MCKKNERKGNSEEKREKNEGKKEIKEDCYKDIFKMLKQLNWKKYHIDFLKKHYPKTLLTTQDLTKKFNKKYHVDLKHHTIRDRLLRNNIKKNPLWMKKMRKNYFGHHIYTPNIISFMKKCSKTMTLKEGHRTTQMQFEQPFSYNTFKLIANRNKIIFMGYVERKALDYFTTEQKKIITKYQNLPIYEIRDKLIEKLGKGIKLGHIRTYLEIINKKRG